MSKQPQEDVNIIRAEHGASKAYFLMSRSTAQDEALTFEAIGTLAYLLSKPDTWVVRNRDLEKLGTPSKIKRIIKELTEHGYLSKPERIRDAKTKKFTGWSTRKVFETPQKTVSRKPKVRKTEGTENNPIDNTDKDNTDKETTLSDKSDGANSTTEKQGYTKDHLQYAITFEWNALKKTGCTPKLDEWKSMFNDSEQLLVLKKAVALSKESLPEIQPQSERDSKAEAMVDTSFEDTQAEQSALDKPNVENDAMKAKRDRAELDVLNEKLVQVAKAKHGLFDEIALALGHDETSLKSKAVGRVVGQTRKAFLDEGFVLGEAKQYIERLRAYYRKQEWTITDEIYKTDKNLARWAKAKANNSEIADVNGVNPANKVQVKSNIQGTGTLETGLVVESEKPPKIDDPEMDRLFDELEAKLS